jgi:hypothetical protein
VARGEGCAGPDLFANLQNSTATESYRTTTAAKQRPLPDSQGQSISVQIIWIRGNVFIIVSTGAP